VNPSCSVVGQGALGCCTPPAYYAVLWHAFAPNELRQHLENMGGAVMPSLCCSRCGRQW